MPKTLTVTLETGLLHINMEPGSVPLKRLLGFAARISSKRKFLLVSKILGKHYPVSPRFMSWSYRALARAVLKRGIIGESLWLGMAETATGLGYGVFAAAYREGIQDGLFMQTTRYHINGVARLEFKEAHSHATDFFLYYPDSSERQQQFLQAKTLVLIDDEISTGKTFLRLIQAYQTINPNLCKVFIVSLINFANPTDRKALEAEAGVAVEWVSLRQGWFHFEEHENKILNNITVNVSGNGGCKKQLFGWPGRQGIDTPITMGTNVVDSLAAFFKPNTVLSHKRPILVLGSGECNAPAYLLGRELERKGYKVKVQSTTRSPIHVSNAIASVIQFEDNYDDNIPNFIYNLDPDTYQEIILCHETPLCASLHTLLDQWNAISARIDLPANSTHATLHFFRP
ncbi:phosphoribosyltransferase domain-containing protein [Crenothrix sp.]|uniref:phosphoribosyltransferase domain-containing protein n=1 Tax=Crenothrix sp. TaxID=3100433 RepID=UPI00374D33A3